MHTQDVIGGWACRVRTDSSKNQRENFWTLDRMFKCILRKAGITKWKRFSLEVRFFFPLYGARQCFFTLPCLPSCYWANQSIFCCRPDVAKQASPFTAMWRLLNQFLNDLNAVCCILQLDFIFEYLTVDDIFFLMVLKNFTSVLLSFTLFEK